MRTLNSPSGRSGTAETIVREIRVWMTRQDVTQTELATWLGIPQSQMSRRLRGEVALDIYELDAVASFLSVDPVVFLRPSVVPWPDGPPDTPPNPPSGRQAVRDPETDLASLAARKRRNRGEAPGVFGDNHRYAA